MWRQSLTIAVFLLSLAVHRPAAAAEDDPTVPGTGKKVSEWLEILRGDKESKRRYAALFALEIAGPAARNVIPGVSTCAKEDADVMVRVEAAKWLGRMATKTREARVDLTPAVEALTEVLRKDKAEKAREAAAAALGRIGGDARSAAPALADALGDKDVGVRREAAEALGRLGPDARPALARLIETLKEKDGDRLTRNQAAFALGRLGPDEASTTVPALAGVLAEAATPTEVRKAAAQALGRLGPAAAESVTALAAALKDKDLELRRAVAIALDQLGTEARPALLALKDAAKDADRAVRFQALHALGNLGKDDAEAVVPVLLEALGDNVTEVRVVAIQSLGNLGPAAKAAVTGLTNAARDGRPAVRDAANEALKKIQGGSEKP